MIRKPKKLNPLVALTLAFALSACSLPKRDFIPKEETIVGIDFTKYSENGFLFTPGEYGEDYSTIGLLTFSIYPEARKVVREVKDREYQANKVTWEVDKIDPSKVIELAYQEANNRGADAITHFKISFNTKSYADETRIVEITGVQVSGLLIKRH